MIDYDVDPEANEQGPRTLWEQSCLLDVLHVFLGLRISMSPSTSFTQDHRVRIISSVLIQACYL